MKRFGCILSLLMALILAIPLCASAKSRGREELVTINLDQAQEPDFEEKSFFQARWIQVTASIEGTQDVTLKVVLDQNHKTDASDKVVYSKTTKKVQGQYVSPEIFLKFTNSGIEAYRIDLIIDEEVVKTAEIHRMLLNLSGNTACLRGIRFRDINTSKTDKWYTFYPINLEAARDGAELEIVGSNMYLIGKLILHRDGNQIMFELADYDSLGLGDGQDFGEGYELDDHMHSHVITNHDIRFSDVRIGVYQKFKEVKDVSHATISKRISLDTWYDLKKINATGNVMLYLNGRVSYNPNGLPRINATYNQGALMKLMDSFAY